MARDFIIPGHIISGSNALQAAGCELAKMGKRALIVTDKVMVKLGNCAKLEQVLKDKNVDYTIYDGINSEPNDAMVSLGLEIFRRDKCDFLIGLGGGSPLDSMKAIGAMVNSTCEIADYMGQEIDVKMPPLVAIPTTAGTGSEATQFTIITDLKRQVKMLLKGKVLLPALAIIDPQFTLTAPPKVTAATGIDALCHAVEAFTSRKSQALSDTFAVSAVERIFKALPKAFSQGDNEDVRIEMSLAALEAGIAFNNSSVTLIHGLSRPIGALFHVPHGLSNAMLLKPCLSFALSGAYSKFAELARRIKVADSSDNDECAANKFLEAAIALVNDLQIPTLEQFGVSKADFDVVVDKMADDALASGSPQNTIRSISKGEILEIYQQLW